MDQIKFGTDGWRGVISDQFTESNLKSVAQASCDVAKKSPKQKLVLIGYDHRFMSPEFARTAGAVFVGNKFKVEISDQPVTSPVLSSQVKARKAAIGVMITASHNPPSFNGFKIKGPHGGSVGEEVTSEIENQIGTHPVRWDDKEQKKSDFLAPYVKALRKWITPSVVSKIKSPVVFDAMHGPGGIVFEKLLGRSSSVEILRKNRDPLFGGVNPEPIEENLALLKKTVLERNAAIGIAVDGDGDRIGVVDDKGHYVPPHTVMPLLLWHLVENRKAKGKVVQTVSMGYLPGRMASHYKFDFEEVPVGFKHVAKRINEGKVLLGGEESGGFGVGLWSPERDGLLCAFLLLELLAKTKRPLSDTIQQLYRQFGKSHFKRIDFPIREPVDKSAWTERIVSHVNDRMNGFNIKTVNAMDGVKVVLDDDSWVLMRPSGTEPLVRTYSESPSPALIDSLLEHAEKLIQTPDNRKSAAPARSKQNRKIQKK